MSETPLILGISLETWKSIPQDDRNRIIKAVNEGSISVAKRILQSLGLGNPNNSELIEHTEGRKRTTLRLLKKHMDALSEIAEAKGLNKTEIMDEALTIALGKLNDVTLIDKMLKETNNFWFNRDLDRVKNIIPIEKAKDFTPYQIAYLYVNLKDPSDRARVFEALGLTHKLDQINAMNLILEKASKFQDGKLLGYNLSILANEIRAKLTLVQDKYLHLMLGCKGIKQLKERTINKFPKSNVFEEKKTKTQTKTESKAETKSTLEIIDEETGETLKTA